MNKIVRMLLLIVVCLGMVAFLAPSYSVAFPPITLGDESEANFYGWIRNNSGFFLQDHQPFSQSSNQLATERTTFRGYADIKISNELRFFSAIEFAYEPWYPVERGSLSSATPIQCLNPTQRGGMEYSEYNNVNDVLRECYFEWKPDPTNSFRIGRQIAIWGEALTTRVGDVIHPDDQRFTFAFANLEDTRIPSWMLRSINDIPALSSSIELIYNPNFTMGESIDTVNRGGMFAIPQAGYAGQRFAIAPEQRFLPPYALGNAAIFGAANIVQFPPMTRDWIQAFPGFWVPTALPSFRELYPTTNPWTTDARGGFRTNTTLGGYNFGVSFFHTQNYDPVIRRDGLTGGFEAGFPLRYYSVVHPDIDIIGAYLNKQLTGSAPIPGVVRFDAIYVPDKPFNTLDLTVTDALVRRDYVKYMVAYDLDSFFYFDWHKDASFDVTFEHVGEVIPDSKNIQYAIYATKQRTFNPSFNMSISTTWLYNKISTQVIESFFPWGRSGLIMPIVKYTPDVLNKNLSFEARYINIYGNNDYEGLGILRDKDIFVFTTQLNF